MKKLAQPTRSFFTLKISWKTSPGWLQLIFHFGTEDRADQLKKNTLYYSIRKLIESVMSKRLLHVLSHKRLAFFTHLVVIVLSYINGQLIQARIFWHCCYQSGADGSFENGAKIQSDVDAGAVREMQPTEQIAIKINGHISNILSRPGQNFSIKDKAGLLRPYFPYFILDMFFNFQNTWRSSLFCGLAPNCGMLWYRLLQDFERKNDLDPSPREIIGHHRTSRNY